MDLLVDARHRGQDRRPHSGYRRGQPCRVGDERERRAVESGGVVDDAREAVRERQEEQHDVGLPLQVRLRAERGRDEVLVREHAALRRAGRAGRVDERGEIVLAHLLRLELGVGAACCRLEGGQLVEADDLAERRQLDAHGLELLALLLVLAGCVRGVEADDDRADRHDRPVEQDPLEPRPREDGHDVATTHAAGEERLPERIDPRRRLGPRDVVPAVFPLLEVGGRRPPLRDRVRPEGGRGTRCKWEFGRRRRRGRGRHVRIVERRDGEGEGENAQSLYNSP